MRRRRAKGVVGGKKVVRRRWGREGGWVEYWFWTRRVRVKWRSVRVRVRRRLSR